MTKLNEVNSTDIADAIRLGCGTMSSVFDADDDSMPFFSSWAWPEARLDFSAYHSEAHVPGRHLNGLLNAEDVLGIKVDPAAIENHARAAFFSYSGPLALPMNRAEKGGKLANFCPHNVREGFHALYALVKYRQDERAEKVAEKSIKCILELWDPEKGWDLAVIEKEHGIEFLKCMSLVHGLGRALGPLVKYYRVTGSTGALHLATLLKDKLIADFYDAEGDFKGERLGSHVHSITCCLSSLAQMAELTGDLALMNLVKAFYDDGLWECRDEIGWSLEVTHQLEESHSEHGEGNNTGDMLETALILGRGGYDECYEDAELILRGHVLPSQLRDVSFIKEPENPEGVDGLRDMAKRHKGAWGFPAPYGHKSIGEGRRGEIHFNMDIVGGVVGSLCEAYRHIGRFDDLGHQVNLLFDHETEDIRIESPYTHEGLKITLRRAGALFVRVPKWVERDEVEISGVACEPVWTGNRLYFPELPEGSAVTIKFALPVRTITMARNHLKPIRVKLEGDRVLAMDNHGAEFTFFDGME